MKFGAIPTNLAERLALAFGKVPIPALDVLYGPMKARALMAGVRLGIFEALRDGPRRAADLAAAQALDTPTLDLLLRVLVLADYLQRDGDAYRLSKLGRRTLLPGAAMDMRGFIAWNDVQWEMIETLEEVVRTGRGADFHATLTDPTAWANYQRGMLEIARLHAPIVARHVPVRRGATKLLDLAGSHGLLGAAICRRHPPLRSTVIDLPAAVGPARALAHEAQIDDIVEHRPGELRTIAFDAGWDVVLLANVLHHFLPPDIEPLLRRVRAALVPGGTIAIWEIERPKPDAPVTDGDGAALYFRLTSTAGAYHGDEYAAWLQSAGFGECRVRRPLTAPGHVLVTGALPEGD